MDSANPELLVMLLHLRGIFQPDSFRFVHENEATRERLVDEFKKVATVMRTLTYDYAKHDFSLLYTDLDTMTFSQCANFMLFYLRLAVGFRGGQAFIQMWEDGTAAKLTDRLLDTLPAGRPHPTGQGSEGAVGAVF